MKHTLTFLLGAAAAACQPNRQTITPDSTPPASATRNGASVSVDRASYTPPADVGITLTSHTRDTLGFNACSSRSFERGTSGGWEAVPEPGRMCTMELRLLMPNETQKLSVTLPGDISAGTYRLVMSLSRQATAPANAPPDWNTVRAVSGSFRVD